MKTISQIIGGAQPLLPLGYDVQDCFTELLTDMHRSFIHHLRVVEDFLPLFCFSHQQKTGRPHLGERKFFRAFVAKSFFRLESRKDVIDRLRSDVNLRNICGFEDLSGLNEATFSRRFSEFAESDLVSLIHEEMIRETLKDEIVGHINRDSTAIETRERPLNKKEEVKEEKKKPAKRGRPRKGEERQTKEEKVLEKQIRQSAETSLEELNRDAAWGGKKNCAGKTHYWKGYKLHLDVTDYGLPVTAVLTGADVHDSQVAIPLEQITSSRINHCYSLMDAAYNSGIIETFIGEQGHVPIIDPKKPKGGEKIPLDPAKKQRYKIRSTVERANAHLKDSFFSKRIYVRGHKKVFFELMCGVLCLGAQKILQYFILPELLKETA